MKRFGKPMIAAMAVMAVVAFAPVSAQAVGFGFFGQGAYSDVAWDFDSGITTTKQNADANILNGGLVYDTTLAKDELVNYRFKFGAEYAEYDFRHVSDSVDDITYGVVLDNTIGFGVIRNSFMRMWIGPELRFGYFWGEGDDGSFTEDFNGYKFGLGPTLGVNFHLGSRLDLGVSIGYRKTYLKGEWDVLGKEQDVKGKDETFFADVTFFFRSADDQYGQ